MADDPLSTQSPDSPPSVLSVRRGPRTIRLTDSVLLLGLGVGFVYWCIASLISGITSPGGTFFEHFFSPGIEELLNRVLVLCFFLIFGFQVIRTIRQRQKADAALAGSEEKHRTVIENIEDGYYEIDLKGRFLIFNAAFRQITGHNTQQLRQLPYQHLLTPAEMQKVVGAFDTVRRTGRAIKDLGFVIVRKDGATRWVETSVSLIADDFGAPAGFRGILRDVTRRRQADALQQEKMAAEAASRSKSEFLANISHEIRTPLNAIIGLVEMLLDSSLSRDQREDLKVVQSAAFALLSVINDVLDFSKIEAGKLELEQAPFNLRDFLGEALKILAVKAHEKNIELTYRVAPDVPDRLIGDHHRFRQVLLNLIGNAVKFTDSGEIVVFAHRKALKENRLLLHVAVRDTGVGIAAGKQAQIFDAFRQADGSTSRKYGGTGLGLAVSAQLVNLMGGQIAVRSELGKGSVFHFTVAFDVASDSADGVTLPDEIDIDGLKILVVDDNITNLKILSEMLTSWKMAPQPAASARAGAVRMRKIKKSGADCDLALIDSDLGGPGALALIRQIRKETDDATGIVVMLTTQTAKETDRFYDAGVRAVITKPVRPSDLLDAIIQALSTKEVPADRRLERKAAHPVAALPGLAILVAEDMVFNQKYIRRLLDSWNCRSTIVDNGRLAVQALAHRRFDLVLMDVQMPEMDGLTATTLIREAEKATGRRHVPIIAMTAHAMRGDRERCLEAGMDDYVPKPIASATLLEAIQRLAPRPDEIPPAPQTAGSAVSTDEDPEMTSLLEAFDNDGDLFRDIAAMFINDYPPMVESLRRAVAGNDGQAVSHTAHALKGMARNFQMDEAAEAALQLERLADQEAFGSMDDPLRRLAGEMAAFEKRLRRMIDRLHQN